MKSTKRKWRLWKYRSLNKKEMRIYWVTIFDDVEVGMMARPKGNDWLEDEIKKLKLYNVDIVISLLEFHENQDLEIEREEEFCLKHGLTYINFPIIDRSVPNDEFDFMKLVSQINCKLKKGKKVVVHCRMGIGRTSVLLAALLISNGFSSDNVFEFLTEKRTIQVPDTKKQVEWIKGLANRL